MLARVFSCAVIGLEGVVVEVEVDTSEGLPYIVIVGLPDAAVQESRERVQSAIKNTGMYFPRKRLTVNLAPASVRKEGPAYDLPIAARRPDCQWADRPRLCPGFAHRWRALAGRQRAPRARRASDGRPGTPARL